MGLRTQHDILTPGSKKQLLAKLAELTQYVQDDCDREVIMYWTAALIQPVVNEFAYYDPRKYFTGSDPIKFKKSTKKKSK